MLLIQMINEQATSHWREKECGVSGVCYISGAPGASDTILKRSFPHVNTKNKYKGNKSFIYKITIQHYSVV